MNRFSISATAIRRHIGTLAITTTAIVLGLFFVFQIQVDLLPSITYPRIGVRLSAPGVSPEVAVEEVTKPLEEALSVTEGVVQIYSRTREGRVSIDLYFKPGGDVDQALNEATASFNRARGRLPDVVEDPVIFKFEPSGLPVYEFALQSPSLKDVDLRVFADEELGRELSVVPGVATVDVSGGVTEEVQVRIDPVRLQALGLGLTDVLDELENRNLDVSGGRLSGGREEPLTRTVGRFQTPEEIRDVAFKVGDRRVYLRDFAEVIDGTAEQRVFVYLNKEPAVKVSIQKQPDANTVAVIEGVKERLDWLRKSGLISDDVKLITTFDESVFIRNAIRNVAVSGLSGAILAALTVLLFLGSLRQTLIIVIAIPLATLTAIVLMKLFGLSLNIFSLGGLALGVGIVVDNAIVMLEAIAEGVDIRAKRSLKQRDAIDAAERSSTEIESALLASTSTNLVSVVPFLLVGGLFSLLFNQLILTISFAVASSLVIALTVVPMLASRLLAIPRSSGLGNFFLLRWFDRSFRAANRTYQWWLGLVLRYRLLVIAIAFIGLGGNSILLAGQLDREILPRINTGQANLYASFPPGTTLAENRRVMKMVDDILLSQPETESVFTTAGGFVFGNSNFPNVLRGSSKIVIKPGSNLDAYIDRCNRELADLNLVNTRLRMSPERVRGITLSNSPTRGEIDVNLQGTDPKLLEQAGLHVLEELDRAVTLARFRSNSDRKQPEVQIRPDWERIAQFDLSVNNIGEALQTAIDGTIPTELQRGDRLVDIRVQLEQSAIQNVSQLSQLPVLVGDDRSIYLQDIAQIQLGVAPGEIQRINRRNVFLIAGNLAEGATLSEAFDQTNSVLESLELPAGVTFLPSFSQATNQQLQDSLTILGWLAAFLVFVVMAVQYNSLVDPLVIIFTIPLALAGGIFGLYITNTAIGATVLVGAILLVGIVVNNAIVMVEFANQIYTEQKLDRYEAILKAASQRLRPILMTTITTVLGLFPLALGIGQGSEFLQPLGIVVFSGLSLATFLTLFIIPCFYTILHDLFAGKFHRFNLF
ncbi:MAG: efflux RND transporter permease subunit [Prochloraceae cyanobacterium]|nr:efflux RND transporter permease subunit [Prochloraceae cyanobacterium]